MVCADLDLEHRFAKPRHPWTNGQIERMTSTINEATANHWDETSNNQAGPPRGGRSRPPLKRRARHHRGVPALNKSEL